MGSCMSCKAGREAYAYTTEPTAFRKFHNMDSRASFTSYKTENKALPKQDTQYSRGQATLFGFKRRPASAPQGSIAATDNTSSVINQQFPCEEFLESNSPVQSGRSTPRLPRPKREAEGNNTARAIRFGYRGPVVPPVTNKVGDYNYNNNVVPSHTVSNHKQEFRNLLNGDVPKTKSGSKDSITTIPKSSNIPSNIQDSNKVKKSFMRQPNQTQASRFTLQTSQLPKPQYPIRLTSVDGEIKSTTKMEKTAANKKKASQGSGGETSSKESSITGDSGICSHPGETDTLQGIELLDCSPTFGLRRNRNVHKPRTLEVVVNGKNFDVRDIKDDDSSIADDATVITEISVISLPNSSTKSTNNKPNQSSGLVRARTFQYQGRIPTFGSNNAHKPASDTTSLSDDFRDDDSVEQSESEAKVLDDCTTSEKSSISKDIISAGGMEEDLWGHGEAMAEGYSSSSDEGPIISDFSLSCHKNISHKSNPTPNHKLNSSNITIDDPLFAAIAAASASTTLIEDEKSPVDSLISSSPPTSTADNSECDQPSLVQDHSTPKKQQSNTFSPESPGTPTNASNSLSLSEGRDFLIDDEIADQPGLTFDDGGVGSNTLPVTEHSSSIGCSSLLLSITENSTTLVDSSPKPVMRRHITQSGEGSPSPARGRRASRTGSIDTLSPCESIASDDLMMDFEQSEGSGFDCTAESRLEGSLGGLHSLDENSAPSDLEQSIREWRNTLGVNLKEAMLVAGRPSRILRSRAGSTPDSPRSQEAKPRAVGSPLRPGRQSSGTDCEEGGVWLDRHTYHSICQDIVNHKTMLLKLFTHLQKNEENCLTRAETLNPFDSSLKNGLFYNLANTDNPVGGNNDASQSPQEEMADLKRQVVFLQQQLEDRERTIQLLQLQMTKYTNCVEPKGQQGTVETTNAATQTERMRPVSAGPSLLQSLPSEGNHGPLVSNLSEACLHHSTPKLPATRKSWKYLPAHSGTGIPLRRFTPPALSRIETKT